MMRRAACRSPVKARSWCGLWQGCYCRWNCGIAIWYWNISRFVHDVSVTCWKEKWVVRAVGGGEREDIPLLFFRVWMRNCAWVGGTVWDLYEERIQMRTWRGGDRMRGNTLYITMLAAVHGPFPLKGQWNRWKRVLRSGWSIGCKNKKRLNNCNCQWWTSTEQTT